MNMNQQLVDDLKTVLQRAEELLETTSDASSESLKAAREKLSRLVKSLRKEWKRLPDTATAAVRASGRVVREHPYETAGSGLLLLALVVGVLWWLQRPR